MYTIRKSAAEIAAHFAVSDPIQSNAPEEVYPGYPGLVIREVEGMRVMQLMVWGFPLRLKGMSPTAKPKPVNNVADLAKPMWKGLAAKPQWRCLIPLTHFAEAEGSKGSKTAPGSTSRIRRSSLGRVSGGSATNGDRSIPA